MRPRSVGAILDGEGRESGATEAPVSSGPAWPALPRGGIVAAVIVVLTAILWVMLG